MNALAPSPMGDFLNNALALSAGHSVLAGKMIAAAVANVGIPYRHYGGVRPIDDTDTNWRDYLDFLGHIAKCYKAATGKDFPTDCAPEYRAHGFFAGTDGWLAPLLMEAGFVQVDTPRPGDVIEFDVRGERCMYTAAIMTGVDEITAPYWGRSCTKSFYVPYWSNFAARYWRLTQISQQKQEAA